MRNPLSRAIMSALVAMGVTSATSTISLSNFTPRIENLPSQCQSAYTTQIQGCVAGDFSQNARCSAACVQGLLKIAETVTQQCANVDVPETSIIGVFLLGQGIPALCPGVAVTTIGASSSTEAPPPQTSAPAEASSTEEAQPPSSSGGIDTDPGVPTTTTTLATSVVSTPNQSAAPPPPSSAVQPAPSFAISSSSSAAPTQTASSQKSNDDSGGGSPFDIVATGASVSTQLRLSDLVIAAVVGVAAVLSVAL